MPRNLVAEAKEKDETMTEADLEVLVEKYVQLKAKEDEIKDDVSALNTQIKALMQELKINKCGPASLTVQHKESFDEEGVIQLLKDNNKARNIVKKKEYVDWDVLEDKIYKGDIDNNIVKAMNEFKTVKEIPTLRISKEKG